MDPHSQPQTPADEPGWPSQMIQKPEVLGQGDEVKRFWCDGILWDWDPKNECFKEHVHFYHSYLWSSLYTESPLKERVQRILKTDFNRMKLFQVNFLGGTVFDNSFSILRRQSEQQKTQSLQKTTESAQHSMNETIIATNRSFLIEELSTLALVRAYTDKGITCFDGLDCTLGRQQRAEGFLTILKKNNLVDSLFDILLEQDMICVFERLNNCRNAYSADPQILRRNILNNLTNILANVDIDDVREIFIEREVLSSSIFDEIEEKYSKSGDQIYTIVIEIIKSGPRAMRTLVDVLYINQLDSLADSLLRRTANEMQKMQDNTQTDEIIRWRVAV